MAKNSFEFSLIGMDDLLKKMDSLSDDIIKSSTRASVNKSMEVVREDAIRRARNIDDPDTPNVIADDIETVTRWDRYEQAMTGSVGVIGGAEYSTGDKKLGKVTYWRFVELGTERSKARPFLRPALQNNIEIILQEFIDEMNRQFDKRIK